MSLTVYRSQLCRPCLALLIALLPGIFQPVAEAQAHYLITSFRGNGENGLHLASCSPHRLVRPRINRDVRGNFFTVMTPGSIQAGNPGETGR